MRPDDNYASIAACRADGHFRVGLDVMLWQEHIRKEWPAASTTTLWVH